VPVGITHRRPSRVEPTAADRLTRLSSGVELYSSEASGWPGSSASEPPESPGLWAQRPTLRVGARRPQPPEIAEVIPARCLTARLERVVKRRFTHHGHRRLADLLKNHWGEVFAYLRHPGMAARNYRGEQSIRPAVVNRKVWGGNRTWRGAWAQAVIMSVIRTCILRDIEPPTFLVEALTSSTPALLAQPPP
jgi:hypothetical protein